MKLDRGYWNLATGTAGVSPAMSAQRERGSSPTVRKGVISVEN
jgi:hypothetical protein